MENLSSNLILTSQGKNLIFIGWSFLYNDRIIPCALNCACSFTFHSTLCAYLGLCVYSFARILLLCVLIWDCAFIWHSRVQGINNKSLMYKTLQNHSHNLGCTVWSALALEKCVYESNQFVEYTREDEEDSCYTQASVQTVVEFHSDLSEF